jgi:exopolysaccharide biosynthesis polyprenyl glycosylphosphotransferase
MLRRNRQIRTRIHQLLDASLFAVSFYLAYQFRADVRTQYHLGLDPVSSFDRFYWFCLALIPMGLLALKAQGFYDRPLLCGRRVTLWQLFKACVIVTLGLILALFLTKTLIARFVVPLFGVTSFVLIALKEEALRMILKSKFAQASYNRRFMLLGSPEDVARMRQELRGRPAEGVEIVEQLDLNQTSVSELVRMLHLHSINAVLISAKHAYFEQVEAAIRACELEGIEAWLVADFFKTQISQTTFDEFQGRPVLVFHTAPAASWQGLSKLFLDFVGAFVLLIVLSPLFLLVSLIIKFTSSGPVLFKQQRSGLNGQPFTIYKFRTMITNAEQLQHELAAMNEMRGPVFKIARDPRITPIGKFLRKFSVDEFPQLFNVLRGEMSLVGPRPLPVEEVHRFDDFAHRRRLSVKPGLTCLWQISGRNNMKDFKDWVRLDLEYIDNWSLWLDLKILCRTVPIVLTGAGAH